jgi:hypothetical protein
MWRKSAIDNTERTDVTSAVRRRVNSACVYSMCELNLCECRSDALTAQWRTRMSAHRCPPCRSSVTTAPPQAQKRCLHLTWPLRRQEPSLPLQVWPQSAQCHVGHCIGTECSMPGGRRNRGDVQEAYAVVSTWSPTAPAPAERAQQAPLIAGAARCHTQDHCAYTPLHKDGRMLVCCSGASWPHSHTL